MAPDTPAAVLEKGTMAAQRTIPATLSTLAAACERVSVQTPAIIVVGRVCELAGRFAWRDRLPLSGVKVLVTRPRELVSGMATLLRERGAEVVELPAIRTVPVKDMTQVDGAIENLARGGFDWLVFTSPSGVRIFMQKLLEDRDIRALAGVKLAAIGDGSRRELLKYGLRCDFVPSVFDGETLGRELAGVCAPGERVLIPRAAIGNRELIEGLRGGADLVIDDLPTYDTEYAIAGDARAMMDGVDFAVFTSASTVKGFAAGMAGLDLGVKAVCIGKQTRQAADALGMKTWVAQRATLESLADAVEEAALEMRNEK
jgi:uroporphyrinogen III methyltransferase/synthase